MKHIIVLCLLTMFSTTIFALNEKIDTNKIEPWLGEFQGTLHIYSSTRGPSTVPMKINNFATDTSGTYGWYLIYGEDEDMGLRPYYLKEVAPEKGHYIVDEKNSIQLDSYLIGRKLISDFEVEGSTITSIYTLVDQNTITFEIIAGNAKEVKVTGGSQDVSPVSSYLVSAYQYAELKRIIDHDK